MNMLGQDPALPFWIVAPPTVLVMLFLAGHVMALQQADIEPRRKRIRTVTGVLMMLTSALLAHALAIISPSDTRTFLLAWLMIVALLGFIILLAAFDALNSCAVYRQAMSRTRRTLKKPPLHPLPSEPQHSDG